MASTLNFVRAIQEKNFPAAKDLFLSLVRDRMDSVLRREYQDTAKAYLSPDKSNQ